MYMEKGTMIYTQVCIVYMPSWEQKAKKSNYCLILRALILFYNEIYPAFAYAPTCMYVCMCQIQTNVRTCTMYVELYECMRNV